MEGGRAIGHGTHEEGHEDAGDQKVAYKRFEDQFLDLRLINAPQQVYEQTDLLVGEQTFTVGCCQVVD